MTTFGKILAFLTLLMSGALGFMALSLHALSTQRNEELRVARKTFEANQANVVAYLKEKKDSLRSVATWSGTVPI